MIKAYQVSFTAPGLQGQIKLIKPEEQPIEEAVAQRVRKFSVKDATSDKTWSEIKSVKEISLFKVPIKELTVAEVLLLFP